MTTNCMNACNNYVVHWHIVFRHPIPIIGQTKHTQTKIKFKKDNSLFSTIHLTTTGIMQTCYFEYLLNHHSISAQNDEGL